MSDITMTRAQIYWVVQHNVNLNARRMGAQKMIDDKDSSADARMFAKGVVHAMDFVFNELQDLIDMQTELEASNETNK